MSKNQTPFSIGIIIAFVLIAVGFAESERIVRFFPANPTSPLDKAALAYAHQTQAVKNAIRGKEADQPPETASLQTSFKIVSEKREHPSPPPAPSFRTPQPPYKMLMIGDSFIAERLGPQLEKELISFKDVDVHRVGIYSTGLSRPDYFDWNEKLKELTAADQPNIAIVMFGANDAQDAYDNIGGSVFYSTGEWDVLYESRIGELMDIFRLQNVMVFWIGMPLPRSADYAEKMTRLNGRYEAVAARYQNARFVPTWTMLGSENGGYADYLPDDKGIERRVRGSDGIHPTPFGAELMKRSIIAELKKYLTLEVPEPVVEPAASSTGEALE